MKHVQIIVGVSVVALNLCSSNLIAADQNTPAASYAIASKVDSAQVQAFIQQLKDVPAAEVANKVAQIISNASASEKQAIAAAVVKAALTLHPTQAGPVIAAIARTSPDVIVVAVQSAVATAPSQAQSITRALNSAKQQYSASSNAAKSSDKDKQKAKVALQNMTQASTIAKEVLVATQEARRNLSQ